MLSEYFSNATCSPFRGPTSSNPRDRNATCTLGGISSYAINIADASMIAEGINFARENNIRLVIKNTGHDLLGRSTGAGALALWTHNLKETSFFEFSSDAYTGPAARIGAGVQVQELYEAATAAGFRATAGGCATVGAAGGWVQSAGHGPLAAKYGLGSDQTLEFDVVTTDGQRVTASRTENPDLFWALSGGGPGNYGVVVSVTMKIFPDGPVAGSRLVFLESDKEKYWAAVEAWQRQLTVLDNLPGMQTTTLLSASVFSLNYATLPDATAEDMTAALAPFYDELVALNITVATNETVVSPSFAEHYRYFEAGATYSRNVTVGDRIIPRSLVTDSQSQSQLNKIAREIVDETPNGFAYMIAQNVTHARSGNAPGDNAVLPSWRDSLFIFNFGILSSPSATFDDLATDLATINDWQLALRDITPGGGSYMNEATYNFPYWKEDYYGETYDRLVEVKNRFDPGHVLWSQPAAGSEAYVQNPDGRLCKA